MTRLMGLSRMLARGRTSYRALGCDQASLYLSSSPTYSLTLRDCVCSFPACMQTPNCYYGIKAILALYLVASRPKLDGSLVQADCCKVGAIHNNCSPKRLVGMVCRIRVAGHVRTDNLVDVACGVVSHGSAAMLPVDVMGQAICTAC